MTDSLPIIINDYHLLEQIGSGGHGVVFKAHTPDGRLCAVKRVNLNHEDDKLVKRMEAEAEIIRALQHPHIIQFYDYWQDTEYVWLVMNWLPLDLRKYIEQHHPLPLARIAQITDEVAEALSVAHAANVVHRDLKPDNILLDDAGKAYLTDFGIAKRLGYAAITSLGLVIGSPAYLTPEQIIGNAITPQTDIYSFGILLYEMLCGEHPFSAIKSHLQLMMMLAQTPLPAVHEKRPDVSAALTAVVHKATALQAEDRYESAVALAQAFRAAAQV